MADQPGGSTRRIGLRGPLKRTLARMPRGGEASGATLLIYHRVGGGTTNELDITPEMFERQLEMLANHRVLSLDDALDRLDREDSRPSFVLTFDDGFADVYENAWPLLRARRLPFTIYLATAYVGSNMVWEGATSKGEPGLGLTWDQLREMVDSGLCTMGNHTHAHVRPETLTAADLDVCTETIERELGVVPKHFTYPWGVVVPELEDELRARFRSASTGELGRNQPGVNQMRLMRVPVRRTDPDAFFAAKLVGKLGPERAYARVVSAAKAIAKVVQRPAATSA